MEWTPEAIDAELAYRRGDMVAKQHLRDVRAARAPRWWQRFLVHRSQTEDHDGNGERSAA